MVLHVGNGNYIIRTFKKIFLHLLEGQCSHYMEALLLMLEFPLLIKFDFGGI